MPFKTPIFKGTIKKCRIEPFLESGQVHRMQFINEKCRPTIGVFDSGIGGLTVLGRLLKAVPDANYVYLGDSARLPYGTKGGDVITRYSLECAEFLLTYQIDLLVIACNTASAAALTVLESKLPVPVIGMIEPACTAVAATVSKTNRRPIGVIGTEGTINSGAYHKKLKKLLPDHEVVSAACPLFVPVVEQGIFEGPVVDAILSLHLSSLKERKPEAVILACTHYPLLTNVIQEYLGADVRLIGCGDPVAGILAEKYPEAIKKKGRNKEGEDTGDSSSPRVLFFTTDSVDRFNRLGEQILSLPVQAEKISF